MTGIYDAQAAIAQVFSGALTGKTVIGQNQDANPGGDLVIRVVHAPLAVRAATIGQTGEDRYDGSVRFDVMAKSTTGTKAALEVIELLRAAGKTGTASGDAVITSAQLNSFPGPDNYQTMSITFFFYCYFSRG